LHQQILSLLKRGYVHNNATDGIGIPLAISQGKFGNPLAQLLAIAGKSPLVADRIRKLESFLILLSELAGLFGSEKLIIQLANKFS
jgi:hypothetical protein